MILRLLGRPYDYGGRLNKDWLNGNYLFGICAYKKKYIKKIRL